MVAEPSQTHLTYTIRQLCAEFKCTPRALRFYEDKGLIAPGRNGINRVYSHRDRGRLQLILQGKRLGLSLNVLGELLDLYELDDGGEAQLVTALAKFHERISDLESQRDRGPAHQRRLVREAPLSATHSPKPRRGLMATYAATVEWALEPDANFAANRYSRGHRVRFDGGITLEATASPHVVGNKWSVAGAVDPEEMLVASLSSCHMLSFLHVAREAGFVATAYRDRAEGLMTKNAAGKLFISAVILRRSRA
jgi:DNA-binding transcriptional MerR regulator